MIIASDRLQAIVERLDVQPDHRILEIGCGHGVAATYIWVQLDDSYLVAIERSEKMIAAAKRRNANFIDAGEADFCVAHLETANFADQRFDRILAMRVGLFWKEPDRAKNWQSNGWRQMDGC